MQQHDPFDFPEVRVKSLDDAPPVQDAPVSEEIRGVDEPKNERLARLWLEAWTLRRDAEAKMAKLRTEIEKLLDSGESVGNNVGYVTWQVSTTLKADPGGLFDALGPQVYVRVSEVSTTKLRELIQAGAIPSEAEYLKTESTKRLVTKLR